jgi:hypothetical protein
LAVDEAGNILVADTGNRRIRKITQGGQVSTLPSKSPFARPAGVAGGARLPARRRTIRLSEPSLVGKSLRS